MLALESGAALPFDGCGSPLGELTLVERLWSYCWGTLVRPRQTIESISSSATAGQGVAIASVFGSCYALAALTSYLTGRRPRGRVLTRIPAERYYLWQSLFTLPVTLLWITLFAASARQVARRLGGTGTYGSDLAMLAVTQSAPMLALMWAPDMVCYLLRVDERRYARLVAVYGSVAVAWAAALSAAGLGATERIGWTRALPTVVVSEVASAVASGTAVVMR